MVIYRNIYIKESGQGRDVRPKDSLVGRRGIMCVYGQVRIPALMGEREDHFDMRALVEISEDFGDFVRVQVKEVSGAPLCYIRVITEGVSGIHPITKVYLVEEKT